MTAAGLTCLHHAYRSTYCSPGDTLACVGASHSADDFHGSEARDTLACVGASFAAATVGFERILADRHYATDVLTGAAVGAVSGVVLPWALFYAHPEVGAEQRAFVAAPWVQPGATGITVTGLW